MNTYDVAIIGGGPGGSTTAAYLKKYKPELKVAIFERETFPRDHVGESHLPGIGEILDEIGCWEKVEAANFPVKIGATYRWGASDDLWDFHFIPDGEYTEDVRPGTYEGQRRRTAWQVDRAVYDKILLDHAAEMGTEVYQNCAVKSVLHTGDRVDGFLLADGGRVQARHYVDCSGHIGILRREMGVGCETPSNLKNVAFWDYWQDAEWAVTIGNGGTRVQVMSLGYGWLWFIPISATRTSCGLVCPAEYYKESGLKPEELYRKAISDEPRVCGLLASAKSEGLFATTKDWSFVADRLVGENWFLVGESAGFADPILAAGMALTHTSAREAAYTILEIERGRIPVDKLKGHFETVNKRKVNRHIRFADYWYTANAHFTDLKEYTRQIAKDAGLELSANQAFQWLGTGGFLEDHSGQPGIGFYSVSGLRLVADRLTNAGGKLTIDGASGFLLKLRNVEEIESPRYEDGGVQIFRAVKRGDKILPLYGLVARILEAIESSNRFDAILGHVADSLAREGVEFTAATYGELIQHLEAMALDGWVKPIVIADASVIEFDPMKFEGAIMTNRDAELGEDQVATSILNQP